MYPFDSKDGTPLGRPVSSASIRRPASSASNRPPINLPSRPSSSASMRPSSSAASVRPSTSASLRPGSSASFIRPSTSASSRPSSRMTQRAPSRFSVHRPPTRQSSRLLPHYQKLVTQLTGITPENDEDNFRIASEFVLKNLDQTSKPTGGVDMTSVQKNLRGLVQKAHILSQDTFATALETACERMNVHIKERPSDLDAEINSSRIPNHLQLLLFLACPPEPETLDLAIEYLERIRNPPKPATGLTWTDILAEEPFEGQHWEGVYGLPPGSTVEGWETRSIDSSPSLSPLEDLDNLDDTSSQASSDPMPVSPPLPPQPISLDEPPFPSYSHLDIVEEIQSKQYWRSSWNIKAPLDRPFDLGDASTIGPAFRRVLGTHMGSKAVGLVQDKYIYEHDAVREVLMGLQGRRNLMIAWMHDGNDALSFIPSHDAPGLRHLTETALHSILSSFARTATALEHLRKFVGAIFTKASRIPKHTNQPSHIAHFHRRSTRTLEAICEAVDDQLRRFDRWCASKEAAICVALTGSGPPLIASLLSLEVAIRDEFSETYNVLLDLLCKVVQRATRSPETLVEIWTFPDLPSRLAPSALTALLLDSLSSAVREYSAMGDSITSQTLFQVFSAGAEPVWATIGRWLKDGMQIREIAGAHEPYTFIDEEFFIEDNELPLLDPDFWADGFVLRGGEVEDGGRPSAVPAFLGQASTHVLSAGKAVGLLRALGLSSLLEGDNGNERWLAGWPSFRALLQSNSLSETNADGEPLMGPASAEDFTRFVYEEVVPTCKRAQEVLSQVLTEECNLWLHLSAMEGLFLMRRGDAITNLIDSLFARMDSQLSWTDFHFLNSAFHDAVDAGRSPWIDPALVRFSHRGHKDKDIRRTVRAIDGLLIEYAVPFPLTYIFGPRAMQVYSSIFVLVLQIRRAKNSLERIMVRSALANMPNVGSELKIFYAMRGKLSWFVNALLNFISTNVLHTQILAFHTALKTARSLDDMIELHDSHLEKLQGRCLLQQNTAALHRAVISILDMTLYFADCFVAFAGDSTLDISRQSLVLMKRHRSRRLKRQRKNIIGFTQSLRETGSSSSSDSDEDEHEVSLEAGAEPSFSLAASSISFAEESFYVRIDKMSSELDALVRFIRRGAESLAGGAGEAASTFGIFAFTLEDWDR